VTQVLATAYLVYLLTSTIGPFGIFDDLRSHFDHRSILGFMHCPWCAAIWCAIAVDLIDLSIDVIPMLSAAFLAGLMCWAIGFVSEFASEYLRVRRMAHE
jgi:hypothetical protein